jgi:hypothetical protein
MANSYLKIFSLLPLNKMGFSTLLICNLTVGQAIALPSSNDLPEEYLRTQIIFEARSPLTGEALTANDYADLLISIDRELQKQASASFAKPYREALFLLRLRKILKNFGVPIK